MSVHSKHHPQLLDFSFVIIWCLHHVLFRSKPHITTSLDLSLHQQTLKIQPPRHHASFLDLPQWMQYFDKPAGGRLNLLIYMQVSLSIQIQWLRTLSCTSHVSLCSGWLGTSYFRFHWHIYNVYRRCCSDCGNLWTCSLVLGMLLDSYLLLFWKKSWLV